MPPIEETPNATPPADRRPPADDPGFELVDDLPARRRPPVAYPVGGYDPRLAGWVRGFLVALALGFATVFGIAVWLNPYTADGERRTLSTHTQLGLPPCNMVVMFGKPCPACGMTTSFALLAHGDPVGSARANWVGTLLALFWLALIPWAAASAARGKYLWVRSGELFTSVAIGAFLVLMLGRWAVVMLQ